jgi:diguanylate cyclase (GGDEF)-like protein
LNEQGIPEPEFSAETINTQPEMRWKALVADNFGLSKNTHWIRVKPRALRIGEEYFVEVNYGLLDQIDVWVYSTQEQDDEAVLPPIGSFSTGDRLPFSERPVPYEKFLFPIQAVSKDMIIIMRVKSKGPVKVPIRIWEKGDFIGYKGSHQLFMGLFFGYMIAMALSNLFFFATTRNKTFAVYTAYVTGLALIVATLQGIGFRFLWPNNIWLQEKGVVLFASATLALVIIFSMQVLDLKNTSPRAYKLLLVARGLFILLFFTSFVLPYALLLQTILIMMALTTPIILATSMSLAMQGNLIARYFSAAWLVLLFSGVALAIENFGLFVLPLEASYLLMVGAIAETLLLALALAVRFSAQYKESQRAKQLAIESEREAMRAKDELLKLQEDSKQALEYSVEERTLELEIAMRELSEANAELERVSAIDPLTNLMNRRYFDKRLLAEARRSRRENRPLTLAMLDIDFFKKVNDNYGHPAGDECLRQFARLLQAHIQRPSDVICRYGGEEFVVIMPATELEGGLKLMEKVRIDVANTPVLFEGKEINMTVSIGLSSKVIVSDDEKAELLSFADQLLYKAKQSGRNQVIAEAF